MKVLMHALSASCEELRARTGNPPLRPVYTGDFCCDFSCDFLLSEDVKKLMIYECSRLLNLITTSLSNYAFASSKRRKSQLKSQEKSPV
jgi:hypothetical protein